MNRYIDEAKERETLRVRESASGRVQITHSIISGWDPPCSWRCFHCGDTILNADQMTAFALGPVPEPPSEFRSVLACETCTPDVEAGLALARWVVWAAGGTG